MTDFIPGQAVRWFPKPRPRTMATVYGYVLEANGDKVRIEANGERFNVSRTQLRPGRACQWCKRPLRRTGKRNRFCCRDCWLDWQAADMEQRVFDAIVAYKKANDGVSPQNRELVECGGVSGKALKAALERLVEFGRIEIRWTTQRRRDIIVKGGRWVYEEGTCSTQP